MIDFEYKEYTLTEVTINEGGIDLRFGWSFFAEENRDNITPEVGDTVRIYGKGIGFSVRGVEIVNKGFLFYRTKDQEEGKRDLEQQERIQEKEDNLTKTMEIRNLNWSKLPYSFQERKKRFEKNNPNWRRDHEEYELFVCQEAFNFSNHFSTSADLLRWQKLPYEKQQEAFTFSDSHSGNTFEASCFFASLFLEEKEVELVAQHGSICPLVGCIEYGCVKTDN